MKTKSIFVMMLLLGTLLPVAGVMAAKPSVVTKPMKGSFSGTWESTEWNPLVLNPIPAGDEGVGTFTHLGKSTFTGTLETFWLAPYYATGDVSGTITLVAANGDELYVDVTGTQTVDVSGTFADFAGGYIIDGGTGRFVGATGSGDIGAHLTIDQATYIEGEIQNGYMNGNIILPK